VNEDNAPPGDWVSKSDLQKRMQEWAEDIRRADERCEQFKTHNHQMQKRKSELEERITEVEKQVSVREDEIRRLHTLYQGG